MGWPLMVDAKVVSLNGCLMPWNGPVPVLIQDPTSGSKLLPVFKTIGELLSFVEKVGIRFQNIKQIHDEQEFLGSFPRQFGIAFDPKFQNDGTVQWRQILRGS